MVLRRPRLSDSGVRRPKLSGFSGRGFRLFVCGGRMPRKSGGGVVGVVAVGLGCLVVVPRKKK